MDQICSKRVAIFSLKEIHYTAIEFCALEFVFESNSTLTKQFGPKFLTKFAQERYLWSKTEKVNIIIEFCIFKSVLVPNFRLNWQFWSFWPDLPKKGFPGLKQKKWALHIFHTILHIYISLVRNFSSNWQFWFFGPNFPKKVFPVENIILHIHISLVQNFSSNWQFWFFGPNFPKKVFPVKDRKSEHYHGIVHILISLGTKYQLKPIILSFWPNLPKKGISSRKQNKQS